MYYLKFIVSFNCLRNEISSCCVEQITLDERASKKLRNESNSGCVEQDEQAMKELSLSYKCVRNVDLPNPPAYLVEC